MVPYCIYNKHYKTTNNTNIATYLTSTIGIYIAKQTHYHSHKVYSKQAEGTFNTLYHSHKAHSKQQRKHSTHYHSHKAHNKQAEETKCIQHTTTVNTKKVNRLMQATAHSINT